MWVQIPSLGLALAVLRGAAQAASPQRFKSSVDMVQVDVSALDSDGRPVTGLTAGDFELRVDGRIRPIASVQFVTVPPDVRPKSSLPAQSAPRYATNEDAAGGRLIADAATAAGTVSLAATGDTMGTTLHAYLELVDERAQEPSRSRV